MAAYDTYDQWMRQAQLKRKVEQEEQERSYRALRAQVERDQAVGITMRQRLHDVMQTTGQRQESDRIHQIRKDQHERRWQEQYVQMQLNQVIQARMQEERWQDQHARVEANQMAQLAVYERQKQAVFHRDNEQEWIRFCMMQVRLRAAKKNNDEQLLWRWLQDNRHWLQRAGYVETGVHVMTGD